MLGLVVVVTGCGAGASPGGDGAVGDGAPVDVRTADAGMFRGASVAVAGQAGNGYSLDPALDHTGRHVAFKSLASNLVPGDLEGHLDVFVRDTCLGASPCQPATTRVSIATDGTEANEGNLEPTLSMDGRFVVFMTLSNNIYPGDLINKVDVVVRDTCLGASSCTPSTSLVSADDLGMFGSESSVTPKVSANGRWVAMRTQAPFVAGDAPRTWDIYVRDTCAVATAACLPSTVRVSAGRAAEPDGESFAPAIAASGRFVAFRSDATNLVTPATAGRQVFLRDGCFGAVGCTPSTVLVSVDSSGAAGASPVQSTDPLAVSGDGRYVAFAWDGALVPADQDGASDIYVRDTCAGAVACTPSTQLVSLDVGEAALTVAASSPSISADGRLVAFAVAGRGLLVRDTCARGSACTPSTRVVPTLADPSQPVLSGDGRRLAYVSAAPGPGDDNGMPDVFVVDVGVAP